MQIIAAVAIPPMEIPLSRAKMELSKDFLKLGYHSGMGRVQRRVVVLSFKAKAIS